MASTSGKHPAKPNQSGKHPSGKHPPTRKGGSAASAKQLRRMRGGSHNGLVAGIGVGIAVVIIALIVVFVVVRPGSSTASGDTGGQVIPSTPTGATTVQETPKRVPNTSGISGVLAWDTEGWPGDGTSHPGALQHDHVTGPVKYVVTPPVGGPHNAEWMNAGVYTKPVPSARAVHNLEHGAIWITYDPDLPKSEVTQLTAFVTKQSMIPESVQASGVANQANRYMDLSPWATNTLPSPIVLSSWGYQLRVTSPTDPRMQKFVDTFRHNQKYTPEFGAAVDGIPVSIGGRPATDGSAQPNPTGSAGASM